MSYLSLYGGVEFPITVATPFFQVKRKAKLSQPRVPNGYKTYHTGAKRVSFNTVQVNSFVSALFMFILVELANQGRLHRHKDSTVIQRHVSLLNGHFQSKQKDHNG